MSDVFEGDVFLFDTDDGGEISVVNGLVIADRKFSTAAYLSLFGGNVEDGGRVDNNKTWWGNRFAETSEKEKIVSRFQATIKSLPLTTKNILLAEQAAKEDLAWMVDEGIADEIITDIKVVDRFRCELEVIIRKDGELIEKRSYKVNWEEAVNGI